jgi:hypothetical protein
MFISEYSGQKTPLVGADLACLSNILWPPDNQVFGQKSAKVFGIWQVTTDP